MKTRKIYDVNEFIDIMSSIKSDANATVCYLSSAKIKKTLRGSNVDEFGSDLDNNRTDGDEEYYDVLKELGNIGAGNATTALAQMLQCRIDMTVPQVRLLSLQNSHIMVSLKWQEYNLIGKLKRIIVKTLTNMLANEIN